MSSSHDTAISPGDLTPPPGRSTGVRHLVVALATAMSLLLYLDRYCIGFLLPYLAEDLELTEVQISWTLSIFFFAYALAQVPSGWLSDRFGARLMLTLYIVTWSLFTGLMGLVASFAALMLLRFGFGLAQAGAYPTSAVILSKWVPLTSRGTASGIVAVGGRFGGSLQPILTAYLLVALVPLSLSSLVGSDDLMRTEGLLQRLQTSGTAPADQLAGLLRERLPVSPTNLAEQAESARDETLRTAVNELLHDRKLYEQVDYRELKLPAEAWELAKIPPQQLSEDQLLRRNRLLVEAAFPRAIRKIYGAGWRPVAIIYGLAGLLMAALFWWGVRDHPRDHPAVNAAELQRIEQGRPAVSNPHGKAQAMPLGYLIRSRSLWLSSISQFGTNFGWVFLVLLLPKYLDEVHRVPTIQRGWMSSLPVFVGMLGMLYGGWLTDSLTKMLGLRWGRALPMALTRFVCTGAYLLCLGLDSPWLLTAAFCLVALGTDLGTPAVWAFIQDMGGRHVGSALGWGNMWGNFGAAVAPLVLAEIADWQGRFLACALAFAVAGFTALAIDARVPLAAEEEKG